MFGANPSDASAAFGAVSGFGFQAQAGGPPAPADPAAYDGPLAGVSVLGQPFVLYLGMIALLFLLKFLSEHDSSALDPADLHIGGYNVLAVGVTASVFIVGLKVLTAKYPIPGLSQFAAFL